MLSQQVDPCTDYTFALDTLPTALGPAPAEGCARRPILDDSFHPERAPLHDIWPPIHFPPVASEPATTRPSLPTTIFSLHCVAACSA